jgi:hypothetical protein
MSALKTCWKRCDHFIGQMRHGRGRNAWSGHKRRPDWLLPVDRIKPEGLGLIVHNYALMQDASDTPLERLLWAEALAGAINRYIDGHLIAGDRNALACLKWWRRQMIADPSRL